MTKFTHLMMACVVLVGSGCESAIDCLDNDGPQFDTLSVSNPILNQVYEESIVVSINNEPRDDNFRYDFNFQGSLPPGVTGSSIGRTYILDGTPIEEGTYRFTIFVEVNDNLLPSQSGLCFYNTSRTFEIVVQPM